MQGAPIPLVWRGNAEAGFLVQSIGLVNRRAFELMPQPPRTGPFVCVVPVLDFWRLSAGQCQRGQVPHFSHAIEAQLIDGLRSTRARLVFDLSNEGPPYAPELFDELSNWLVQHGMKSDQVAFVSQNRALAAQHRKRAAAVPMRFFSFDSYIVESYVRSLRLAASSGTPAEHDGVDKPAFLCLNYTPRPHRVCLLLALLRDGRLDRGLVSFPGLQTEKHTFTEQDLAQVGELARLLPGLTELLPQLRARGRFVVDEFTGTGNELAFHLDPELHARARSVIVTESDFSNGAVRRVTEKSIKPLLAGRAFVIFGNPHSLALLRELGFQSFHPLIDEAYDEAADPALRLVLVDREITRIVERTPAAWRAFELQARDVCNFNRRLLLSGGALSRYWDLYAAPFLRWLRSAEA